MRFAGSMKCHACVEGDHRNCMPFDLIDEETGAYATCSCECRELKACASFDEERGAWVVGGPVKPKNVTEARRNEFFATIEALAKAQAIGLGGKP